MPERSLLRIGSVSAIVGAILAVIVNVLHPRVGEFDYGAFGYSESFLQNIVDTPRWVTVHNLIVVAVLLVTGGLLALHRSIATEPGRAWARLGFAAAMVSAFLMTVNMALDGIALKVVAVSWADATPEAKGNFFNIANSLVEISLGLFALWIAIFWGLTFILYGLAISLSEVYPKWLGWIAVVVGIGAAVLGVIHSHEGASMVLSNIYFGVVSILLTLWVLVMGVLMGWRAFGDTVEPEASRAEN